MSIQAVERALLVLDMLTKGPLSLIRVSEQLGITSPGAMKILRTLEQRGLVRQTENKLYMLAAGCCRLARSYCRLSSLPDLAREEMTRISLETRNDAILAILEGVEKVNLLRLDASRAWNHLESAVPERVGAALSQATGRVLLAFAPEILLERHLAAYPLERFGGGLQNREEVNRELEKVRERGYAIVDNPRHEVRYLAAPLRDATGTVVAALGAHLDKSQSLSEGIALVCKAAERISAAYGN
jgi:DNA-binding IclR family transcriptional regulator